LSNDEHTFGTKVEIKNINSITNAKLAAEYEIKRQSEILDKNEVVQQETRRFDDTTLTTVFMRKKADAIDYRYMTEPNILAIYAPKEFVNETLKNIALHPYELKQVLKQNNINQKDINLLLSNKKIYDLFQQAYALTLDYKDASR
ncbi:Asp-tRNA(Asn)/Glu-tRNA(Gln) amidotransferase GatCAB subunit B, partial [bacterium]|nr:Asp-tRNA(Asn)/Glu-tRNA(Gln) amidotransferase GatCAB subunit B [bacterium]